MITNPLVVAALFVAGVVLFAVCAIIKSAPTITDALRRNRVNIGLVVFAIFATLWGGTKPAYRFNYDGGVKGDATRPSYVTNDTEVVVYWVRDPSAGYIIPDDAPVFIDYRDNATPEAEWQMLAQTTVSAWSWTGTLAGATNCTFNVWGYYVPPPPVHTNGVWTYTTMPVPDPEKGIIPLRARIEADGRSIYPEREETEEE